MDAVTKVINNFADFRAKKKETDWEFSADDLTKSERAVLRAEIASWGDKELEPAVDVLSDYYSIELPADFLKGVLQSDLELAFEVYSKGVRDTCQRTILVDAVLAKIGCRSWPIYFDGEEAFLTFISVLPEKLAAVGGKLLVSG